MTDELTRLLEWLGRQGFVISSFQGDRNGPDVLAAIYDWGETADVLIMHSKTEARAYRALTGPEVDLLAPGYVVWTYFSNAVWTLRAVLTLPAPNHPEAPVIVQVAPPGIGLPMEDRRPVRLRMRQQYSLRGDR
ncbi:MAG TPA: hypothetical protein VFV67_29340 [Actinophytocola sp.]|uniref:hypothetical protein n=1 Tax=Actinophytocola sp. TaxID=1872138 RepID=UPI002DBAE904|nr:hypothetical protein [Actinophytocola sp.]HEU5474767.1 hypothetical protein [Actinophytocola sp.]